MGINKVNAVWTDEEREFVRANASRMTDFAIARELTTKAGRVVTLQAARKQRQKMKLRKSQGRGVCKLQNTETESANA